MEMLVRAIFLLLFFIYKKNMGSLNDIFQASFDKMLIKGKPIVLT